MSGGKKFLPDFCYVDPEQAELRVTRLIHEST